MQLKAPTTITERSPTLRPQDFAVMTRDTIPAAPPPGCMASITPSCPPVDDQAWGLRTTLLLPRVSVSPESNEERRRIRSLISAGIAATLANSATYAPFANDLIANDASDPCTSLARALAPGRTSGWARVLTAEGSLAPLEPWDDAS